jgi:hypothetical protein
MVSQSPWLAANGGSGFNFDGSDGTDILSYGITIPGIAPGPNPGGVTTAVIDGYGCGDTGIEPKEMGEPQDTLTSCQDSAIAWGLTPSGGSGAGKLTAGFDNLVMLFSTNVAGEIISANAYYTMEYPIINAEDNSWVGGTLSFSTANPIPIAVDDPVNAADVNVLTNIDVLANDTDLDDTPLIVNIVSGPAFGTANVVDSGGGTPASIRVEYAYTATTINASDSFTYTIDDSTPDTSNTATVTVQISNKVPTAADDNAATDPGLSTTIPVLNNDTLGDEPTATVSLVPGSGPSIGTAAVETDLQITYTSTGGPGTDTFRYTLEDYNGDISNEAEVTITICPIGTICAVDDNELTDVGVPVSINPLTNDAGLTNLPLMGVTVLTPPAQINGTIGTISGCDQINTCDVPYTPGAAGPDSFVYQVEDSMGSTDSATVNVVVNDLPVAMDDVATTNVGTAVNVPVLTNDLGLSDTPLVVTFPTSPTRGTLAQNGCDDQLTCVVTYTSDGTPGPDMFTYTVTDNNGDVSNIATAMIRVNDLPDAMDDAADVEPGNAVDIPVLLNDSGLNDIPLTVNAMNPANGSVTQTGCDEKDTCIVTYTNSGATGVDTFDYTVTDVDGDITDPPGTVSVTVADPSIPIAIDDVAQTSRDTAVTIDVLANDSGLVDVPITLELATPARNGRLTVNGSPGKPEDISVTYEPGVSFFGNDSFIYRVSDTAEPGADPQSDQATVIITVVDDQVIITIPSDDGSSLSPWSLALLSVLVWLRRRKRT